MPKFSDVTFVKSVYALNQLPEADFPEIAFAGRSNVGKSSLINRLINRKNLVKTSSKPGKTQSLNFFLADNSLYLVDLPGYGYAKAPKEIQARWGRLISSYLESRNNLCCVVVILDLRHSLKTTDLNLITWLRDRRIPFLSIYTKQDKLSRNDRLKHAAKLDSELLMSKQERVLFSSKTGEGKDKLLLRLDSFL